MEHHGTPYRLARELLDAPEAIRRIPAPELPVFDASFALRLADPQGDDPAMLEEWMARPHLLETWEQAWSADRRRQDWEAQLAGTYSRPCILAFDFAALGQPELGVRDIAYVELYRAARDEIGNLYDCDGHDVGVHIATADPALTGRGLMSGWLRDLGAALFAAEPECGRILLDPDHRNIAIQRAITKYDWRKIGTFDVRVDRRIALYAKTRAGAALPVARPELLVSEVSGTATH
ncbi:acetyltransferase [Nocardia sp. 2]|uniref:Lysine N-acyltransferase MbtK n=1 Tax=Nocardia acididurans TaxID=2802282 RepID=A0ABS1MA97_9NOCA|nr:GNAT family N-acetyltransferase [Nocardia acididurans]MBL1077226.1 acetyltransferase [Nocardia acididurans]